MSRQPRIARLYAVEQPTIPPPTITTLAWSGSDAVTGTGSAASRAAYALVRRMWCAALWPGAPVTSPAGCVPPPQR